MTETPQGKLIARGTCRLLQSHGFVTLTEFVPSHGLRVDIMALGPKSEIWIVECKSSQADFTSDKKWQRYLEWCDRYFWAVASNFPVEILPQNAGLIIADAYDGEIIHLPKETLLNAARRKTLLYKFGRNAAARLAKYTDPQPSIMFNV